MLKSTEIEKRMLAISEASAREKVTINESLKHKLKSEKDIEDGNKVSGKKE